MKYLLIALLLVGSGCIDGVPEGCADWVYAYRYAAKEGDTFVWHQVQGYCHKETNSLDGKLR